MPKVKITVTEEIEVPEGTKIILARTGVVSALRLPDGQEIKPWITYEADSNGNEPRDLDHDELMAMDVATGLDFERTVDGELEEIPYVEPTET